MPLEHLPAMKRRAAQQTPQRLLRWIFRRGTHVLVCRVDQQADDRTFTLSLAPSANVAAGIAETFTSAWSAFRRHAMIASELRRAGWRLAAYTAD